MGCSRAGETAGISPFEAGAVLDRASPAAAAGPFGFDRSSTGAGSALVVSAVRCRVVRRDGGCFTDASPGAHTGGAVAAFLAMPASRATGQARVHMH
jgi:hypothetical protein